MHSVVEAVAFGIGVAWLVAGRSLSASMTGGTLLFSNRLDVGELVATWFASSIHRPRQLGGFGCDPFISR